MKSMSLACVAICDPPGKRPFAWWVFISIAAVCVVARIPLLFHITWMAFQSWSAYRWYVKGLEKIRQPALEHRRKYRRWYEEQDAARARYKAQKRRRLWT
jgi:hypothetical protein